MARREVIARAMQHDRRLTVQEAWHVLLELEDHISSDQTHDAAKHLGAMSADMVECEQCHALTAGVKVMKDHLRTME